MPRRRRPHVASSEEVHITRDGDDVMIEYADPSIPAARFAVGRDRMAHLTDGELLELWNDGIEAGGGAHASDYVATEVPQGRPQIERSASTGSWVPRGTVLRCVVEGHVESDSDRGFVNVDGQAISLKQFGKLLAIFEGWGMRIEFVPEHAIGERPRLRVQDPKSSKGPSSKRGAAK